ncbi:segregation and condensation protein A [Virgibacillus natechei]|uniref:Segregation and condensation protein A n=1 Tax=Virgibacillus natechei TaxID=1216297 RepID=A0ABS4IFC8_9BACI|nr:segregation/condensation protein A [Virgibacillus natechei]MBP1969652.1 segregation and condensation protein A [Virgibacillus natechei]UZD11380.1 segregation/condensation protein A [Virgibacillus natechei]
MDQAYQVKLDVFEGPLDLLLHLINQFEIDIYDIPMSQITDQYMHYIHTMQRLDLNIASEYLVMAATLVAIKSQMLLPKQKLTDESEEFIEDPREELMKRLIEYRKYKEAADKLKKIEINANQLFTRPPFSSEKLKLDNQPVVQGNVSVYEMLSALGKMMERKKWNEPLDTKIKRAEISIEYKMEEVLQLVKDSKKGISFDQLFTYKSRSHIVVTFMALLELMKANEIYCKQQQQLDVLYVFYRGG